MAVLHIKFANDLQQSDQSTRRMDWGMIEQANGNKDDPYRKRMTEFDLYRSPYSWRYSSPAMQQLWSETHKRRLWRMMWTALAEAQSEFGLVRPEQVADLRAHQQDVDITRALEIEAEIHHDLMAELRSFAEQCQTGRGIIHLGATSMDIEDNADALRIRQALDLILEKLSALLEVFADKIAQDGRTTG